MLKNESYPEKPDQELAKLTLRDKNYYRFLVQRYEGKLRRYVTRIAGVSAEDAEDILQETFIKVYRNLNDFDPNVKFSSWIYRIAHNETINHLRRLKGRPRVFDSEANEFLMDNLRSDLNIEEQIDDKYLAENIVKVINCLDEKYRSIIILKYMEDKDYQEISDILKKPMGTVASLLKRAKGRLKKEMLESEYFQKYV